MGKKQLDEWWNNSDDDVDQSEFWIAVLAVLVIIIFIGFMTSNT